MAKTIKWFGLDVVLGTPDECEAASYVVCGNISYFADDVRATCAICGTDIVHRPYIPVTPPKICLDCLHAMATESKH